MRKESNQGFTLIEIAIVLVIVGLLVGMGASMVGPLSKQAKRTETKRILEAAKESLIGYALINNSLPVWGDATPDATTDEFCEVVSKRNDSWAQPLRYVYDARIAGGAGTLCAQNDAYIRIVPLVGAAVTNVAFVILSAGEDYTVQSTIGASGPVGAPTTITQQGDDLIEYMSIYELQSRTLCGKCSAYEIYNNIGSAYFRINGIGCYQVGMNGLIASIGQGGSIQGYTDSACTLSTTPASLGYIANNVPSTDNDRDCMINFNNTDR